MKKKNMSDMTTEMKIQSITVVIIMLLILLFFLAFLMSKKQTFSEGENRYLQTFPAFSLAELKEGKYTEKLQNYVTDHFPLRDCLMELKAETEIAFGKRKMNGVYICRDDYLIEEYEIPENTEKIIGQFAKFSESVEYADVSLMLVPTAVTVYEDKLPALTPTKRSQMEVRREILDRLSTSKILEIDCYDALMEVKEDFELYYRTDHHWTSYGAYAAYTAYCEAKGLTPVPLDGFKITEITSDFRGTVYSKLNDGQMKSDTITVFENPDSKLTVLYQDTGETSDSLYNFEYLEKKDKYSLFLNNIHPFIEITNEAASSVDELALIKDSYANCMVPFLTNHYRKIYVFDTRYYKGGPSAFINENRQITDVLLLYNMNTLDGDLGIGGIY